MRVRNEWQTESFQVSLKVDPDRANLAGITNLDVANSATSAMSGTPVTTLAGWRQEHSRSSRACKLDERAQLSDIQNLYVYSLVRRTRPRFRWSRSPTSRTA